MLAGSVKASGVYGRFLGTAVKVAEGFGIGRSEPRSKHKESRELLWMGLGQYHARNIGEI